MSSSSTAMDVEAKMGEFEVHFSAELLELRKYLDLQFERQAQLLTEVLKRGHIPSVTLPIPPTPTQTEDDVPVAQQRESVSLSEKSRLSVAISSGFGSEVSRDTPPSMPLQLPPDMKRQVSPDMKRQVSPGMKRQVSPGTPRVHGTSSRLTTVSMRSRRKTFVRDAMQQRHQVARRAATKSVLFGAVSDEEVLTGWDRLKAMVLSPCANYFIMSLIILNAALLGIEIDMSAKVAQSEVPTLFGTVNEIIVLIFVIEIFLKLLALGCKEFWRGEDALWNTFDVIIVSLSVVEVILDWLAQTMAAQQKGFNAVRILRTIRIARIFRGVRITRLFRYFSALRALILSIMATWGSLMWTMLLLLLLFYVFSVCFTQLVTDHCRLATIESMQDVNAVPVCNGDFKYWSDVIASMHTLFLAITGGIEWRVVYQPLKEISPAGVLLMNLYIIIGFFTVLNVVTGVLLGDELAGSVQDAFPAETRLGRPSSFSGGQHGGQGGLPQLPAEVAQSGGQQGGQGGLPQLPAEVAQVEDNKEDKVDFNNYQLKLLKLEDSREDKVDFHNFQPKLLNQEDNKEDKVDFRNYLQLSMWLLTSAGHILLPIVMRSFIIFGKVGNESSGRFSHSRIGVIPKICARKSMMLHSAVWRGYVHLWATYMKWYNIWQRSELRCFASGGTPSRGGNFNLFSNGRGAVRRCLRSKSMRRRRLVVVETKKNSSLGEWTDDDLFKVMKEAGWSDCAVVAYPTKRIWPRLVCCRPPLVVIADVAAVRCEDVFLSLEKATSRSTKRETTKVPVRKKAAVHVHNVELDPSQDLVPPTAMDTDREAGQEEHLDDQSMGVAAQRSTDSPAPGEKPQDKRLRTSVDPQKLDLGPVLVEFDCGASGACGYNCIAAGTSLVRGASWDKIKTRLAAMGNTLRVQAAQHITNHPADYKGLWVPDGETTEDMEDG
eukprot:symbB.v1.2.033338.t1/scaffold4118.1/size44342/1